MPQKETVCTQFHKCSKAAFSPEGKVGVKSNKADPAFYYDAQSRRASLRRGSSITRNPPRIQLLRCNLPLLLSGEGGGNKVPFILPTFEGRSASESEREEESLSLYLSPRSALKLISKRPPSFNGQEGTPLVKSIKIVKGRTFHGWDTNTRAVAWPAV